MQKSEKNELGKSSSSIKKIRGIKSLNDLVRLNLETLEGVENETEDFKKAALIFTGSRTVTGALKIGIEAMKLGIKNIGGVGVGSIEKQLTE